MSARRGEYLARLLIRHNIIHRAAIDDPEGYDGGHTLAAVVEASRELGIDVALADLGRLQADLIKAHADIFERILKHANGQKRRSPS